MGLYLKPNRPLCLLVLEDIDNINKRMKKIVYDSMLTNGRLKYRTLKVLVTKKRMKDS